MEKQASLDQPVAEAMACHNNSVIRENDVVKWMDTEEYKEAKQTMDTITVIVNARKADVTAASALLRQFEMECDERLMWEENATIYRRWKKAEDIVNEMRSLVDNGQKDVVEAERYHVYCLEALDRGEKAEFREHISNASRDLKKGSTTEGQ
ncbi:hypothetical protein B9Z65_2722 [Elsinoe australis]|uniref:Uncharacterized protein n=1 Tax=Elsinoe australis TaxID=40998 RepID=A0A2P8A4E8_9PEZI|nr:hypothetical protein B9Z65_2722 [Elsinoe australis]